MLILLSWINYKIQNDDREIAKLVKYYNKEFLNLAGGTSSEHARKRTRHCR